jgi:AcrR family transcriptional regulator
MLEKVRTGDPRVRRTRQLLLDALMDLMIEKPFQSISVQDIAARATVNRATFYAHYVDKNALLNDLIQESFKLSREKRVPANAQLSPENMRLLLETVCSFLAELYGRCSPSKTSQLEPLVEAEVKKQVMEVLRGWLKPPKGSKSADTSEVTATVTSWAIYGAAHQWSRTAKRIALKDYIDQVLPMILSGMQSGVSRG